jgi:hypothetical protein
LDKDNLSTKTNRLTGLVGVETTNSEIVPLLRAADIQRALNSVAGYLAVILAHELGHLLGASAPRSLGSQPFPMPDGTGTGSYMNQDDGGHDVDVTSTGLMVNGNMVPRAQQLGVAGPERSFRAVQSAFLKMVLPRAIDFTSG